MCSSCAAASAGAALGVAAFECELDHWPTSLILPLLASGYCGRGRLRPCGTCRARSSGARSAPASRRAAAPGRPGCRPCAARLRCVGAAEIPVRPVRDVGAVEGRAEIVRPQAARAGLGQHLRIVDAGWCRAGPDRRCDRAGPRSNAAARRRALRIARISRAAPHRGALVRRAGRHLDDDAAGRLAPPGRRERADLGALRRRRGRRGGRR